ncbi:MAG: hypothetical protein KGI08_04285 [Thaumarchaeota archaeon]|nr:hypothetical protein [Nitrososphaerota archaeon]
MPTFTNKLDELLADVVLSNNINRLLSGRVVKQYWDTLSKDQKKEQLSQITSLAELNILNSLGIPKEIYTDFLLVLQKATRQGAHA